MHSVILNDFKEKLATRPTSDIVQEVLFDAFPYCFKEKPSSYGIFRKEICDIFQIHPQNFSIVGSAKVGFSLSPEKFGREFNESSDIDVVLVSEELFQEIWLQLIEFKRKTLFKLDRRYKERFETLQYSLFYGIIRLDRLSDDFDFAKKWWVFFNKLSVDKRFGPRRIRGALFKSWKHVSLTYEENIRKLREQHESNSN